MEETRQKIKQKYFSPKSTAGYNSLTAFLRNAKYKNKWVANDVLNSLKTFSVHKGIRQKYPTRKVMCNSIDQYWTMDLGDVLSLYRSNSFYKHIFVAQDIFSQYMWAIPIKKKDTNHILEAIKLLLKKANGRKPIKIWADREAAWTSKKCQEYFKSQGIQTYYTFSKKKAVYSELAVKHLKSRLYKIMTHNKSKNWTKHLNSVVYSLNHGFNSSIGMAPADVTEKNESEIWDRVYGDIINMNPPLSKLRVGDYVRIGKNKLDLGRKSYLANWTDEIFKIASINFDTRPIVVYSLVDLSGEKIQGTFTEHQLNKVSFPTNSDG